MNAGKLRHRVRLEEPTRVRDAGGGGVDTWSAVAEVWGNVVPLTGAERIAAMQTKAALTHRVEIRHRVGLHERMRAVYAGRVFNIHAVVDVDERHDEVHLLCEEIR